MQQYIMQEKFNFDSIEDMGAELNPKCGSCKCSKCPLGAKDFTLKKKPPDLIEKESEWKAEH